MPEPDEPKPLPTPPEPFPLPLSSRLFGRLALGVVLFLAACAPEAPADPEPNVDGPWQVIDSGIDPEEVDFLLASADLDDAKSVADYHIYRVDVPGLDLNLEAPNCGLAVPGPYDSTCGGCYCLPELGLVCVDYACDPSALRSTSPQRPAAGSHVPDIHPPLIECDNGAFPGESWMEDCNVCTCLADGTTSCTLIACGQQVR